MGRIEAGVARLKLCGITTYASVLIIGRKHKPMGHRISGQAAFLSTYTGRNLHENKRK
jgi:hypothetical protein